MEEKFLSSSNLADININDYYSQTNQQSSQTAITAFLAKLWALVNDPSSDDLIAWDPSGSSFHVFDQSRFSREILPRYFKHNNFASFIRQLNMYGFRKISTIEHGSLKNEHNDVEFAHPNFMRGHDTLLELIKRRAPETQQKSNIQIPKTELSTPKNSAEPSLKASAALISTNFNEKKSLYSFELAHIIDDVRNLQAKQTSLSDKLFHMEDENQALWREVSLLKQKHSKQQQIVSNLMDFFIHLLASSTRTQRPSVEQPPANPSQQEQPTKHTIINAQISNNSLKRKPAVLMLGEEPKKRISLQQNILSEPQGVTINELDDSDINNWLRGADSAPLVDLVPSPPSLQTFDEHYQQQPTNCHWPIQTNDIDNTLNFMSSNKSFKATENSADIPESFMNLDNTNGTKQTLGHNDETKLTNINTPSTKILPIIKAEQINFPNALLQNTSTNNPLNYSNNPKQEKLPSTNTSGTDTLSLHDITGDVNHIQTSLDNIREFMFGNLPDSTTIEDLFCDDPVLLSPLLTNNTQTTNILTNDTRDEKVNNHFSYTNDDSNPTSSKCKQIILHRTESPAKIGELDVNNQLLEQLINETARIEEHRQVLNQLERDKLNLEDKIKLFEQNSRK